MSETLRDAIDRALDAYAALGERGEEIEDDWSYVTELGEAWEARFEAIRSGRGDEVVTPATSAALTAAIEEIGRIDDPHRAIDWLSTFPQVILVAIGERP